MEWKSGKRKYGFIEPRSRWQECVDLWKTTTTEYYERKIKIYNDGSVEEGEWVKVDTKSNTIRT